MSVEMMQRLSLIFFIASGVMLITAVILFFALKVPKLFRELTGIAANQGIKNIDFKHSQVESSKLKMNKSSRLRNIMTNSGNLKEPTGENLPYNGETRKLKTRELVNDMPLTTVLISNKSGKTARLKPLEGTEVEFPVIDPNKKATVLFTLDYMSTPEIIE